MSSRRTFLKCVAAALPLSGCASIPPDLTKRSGGAGDPASKPSDPWRPEMPGPDVQPSAEPPAPSAEASYVCPMHPEVKEPSPGTCPKCSMALVLKKKGASR